MPRDSSGNYALPAGNPVVTGTAISSTWANSTLSDLANEVENSLDRNGRGGMLAAFKFADGSLAAPGSAWTNEPGLGFYRAGAGDMRWVANGNEYARVLDATGFQFYRAAAWRTPLDVAAAATITGLWNFTTVPTVEGVSVRAASLISSGEFALARIPTLDASKIPNLDAAKITTGTFADARIPSLDASKISTGALAVARGGTGLSSYTAGNFLYAASASVIGSRTPAQVLSDIGAEAAFTTLGVAKGGTGAATLTSGSYLRGNGTGAVALVTPANVRADIGADNASNLTSGTLPAARYANPVNVLASTRNIAASDINAIVYKSNTTAYTLTLIASVFANGQGILVQNRGSAGNITVAEGASQTIYHFKGLNAAPVTGSVVLQPGSVVTFYQIASNVWHAFGGGTA